MPGDSGLDRRAHPRVKLSTQITARLVGTRETFVIDEASTGGFSLSAPRTFEEGQAYRFRLESPSGQAAVISAQCRYCRASEQGPAYCVGFQFAPQDTQRLRLILGAIANEAP
jgi:hypothetical protein